MCSGFRLTAVQSILTCIGGNARLWYLNEMVQIKLELKNFSIEISALQKAYDDSELRPELTIKKYLIVQNEDIYHV